MSRLVVSADDGGLAASTDTAILRCVRRGVVRSVSVVAGGPTAEAFLSSAEGVDLGLHVNLTQGRALAGPASTLTDGEGFFLRPKQEVWRRAAAGELDPAEVRAEVTAQWRWLADRGAEPGHLDGHNHVHVFPVVRDVLAELAPSAWMRVPLEDGLPGEIQESARTIAGPWPRADRFAGHAFSEGPTVEIFLAGLDAQAAVTEFMVHPGSRPGTEFTSSPLRDEETGVLCSERLGAELERRGFRLASFGGIPCS